MSAMIDQLRSSAMLVRAAKTDPDVAQRLKGMIRDRASKNGWTKEDQRNAMLEMIAAEQWMNSGSVVYELTHSMAALFALTSAPRLDWSRTPHSHFLVKVPRLFFPIEHVTPQQDTWILAGPRSAIVIPDHDTTAVCIMAYPDVVGNADELRHAKSVDGDAQLSKRYGELCGRFLANTIAYITEHRETVTRDSRHGGFAPIVIRPPVDVVITKDFRDAASQVVQSRSMAGTRRALAHVVRGHWRNQPVGPGRSERRLTWVRPHKRGDESLGKVVTRIERIHTPGATR